MTSSTCCEGESEIASQQHRHLKEVSQLLVSMTWGKLACMPHCKKAPMGLRIAKKACMSMKLPKTVLKRQRRQSTTAESSEWTHDEYGC